MTGLNPTPRQLPDMSKPEDSPVSRALALAALARRSTDNRLLVQAARALEGESLWNELESLIDGQLERVARSITLVKLVAAKRESLSRRIFVELAASCAVEDVDPLQLERLIGKLEPSAPELACLAQHQRVRPAIAVALALYSMARTIEMQRDAISESAQEMAKVVLSRIKSLDRSFAYKADDEKFLKHARTLNFRRLSALLGAPTGVILVSTALQMAQLYSFLLREMIVNENDIAIDFALAGARVGHGYSAEVLVEGLTSTNDANLTIRVLECLASNRRELLDQLVETWTEQGSRPAKNEALQALRQLVLGSLRGVSLHLADRIKLVTLADRFRPDFLPGGFLTRQLEDLFGGEGGDLIFAAFLKSAAADPGGHLVAFQGACADKLRQLYKEGRFRECDRLARALIEVGECSGEFYRYAILAGGKQHHFAEGLDLAREALAKLGEDATQTIWKVRCASAAGDFSMAIPLLVAKLEQGECSADFWSGLADFLWSRGDLTGAFVAAMEALARNPGGPAKRLFNRLVRTGDVLDLSLSTPPAAERAAFLIKRLQSPAAPVTGQILSLLIKGENRDHADPARVARVREAGRVAVVGMHLGFGGAPQKAMRVARAIAEPQYALKGVYYFCPNVISAGTAGLLTLEAAGVVVLTYSEEEADESWLSIRARNLLSVLEPQRRRKRIVSLANLLRKHAIDTVHAIGTNELQVEAGIAAALAGARLTLLNPGMMRPELYAKKDGSRDEARAYADFFKAALANPSIVVCNNSNRAAQDYADWIGCGLSDISVLRNGIRLPTRIRQLEVARKVTGLPADRQIVVIVGRIAHEKRPEVTVDVLERLVRQGHDRLLFIFLGDGPLRPWLEAELSARGLTGSAQLEGFVHDPGPYYEAADCCLMISDAEGLPNVLIEAQSFGLPVVATDAGGARETLQVGVSGFIVGRLEVDAIVSALASLLDDPELRAKARSAARSHAVEFYSMDRMARNAVQIYRGGRGAAADLLLRELAAFGSPEPWPGGAPGVAAKVRALAAEGDDLSARRLLRWALRHWPTEIALWSAVARLDAGTSRLRRSRPRYRKLIIGLVRTGRLPPGTAAEALYLLGEDGGAVLGSGAEPGPHEIGYLLHQQAWTRLRALRHLPSKAMGGGARSALILADRFQELGLGPEDGETALESLLRYALSNGSVSPGEIRNDKATRVAVWVGNLGLGGGERQVTILLRALSSRQETAESILVVDQHVFDQRKYNVAAPTFAIDDWDATGFSTGQEIFDHALVALEESLPAIGGRRLRRAMALLAAEKVDVVHVRGVAENAIVAASAGVLIGARRVVINVGTMLHSRQSDGSASGLAVYARNARMLSMLARLPQVRFIFNSRAAQKDWASLIGKAVGSKVIYNGFERSELSGELGEQARFALTELEQKRLAGARIVLGVFRFHSVKRPLTWLRAAVLAARKDPHLHFAVVGAGPVASAFVSGVLREGLRERFTFFGAVSNGLANIYSNSEILLNTSEVESAPNVIIEAQAFGCAVVAPDVGGIRELVTSGTARLFPGHDPSAIASLLVATINDVQFLNEAAGRGPTHIQQSFDPQSMAKAMIETYWGETHRFGWQDR